MGGNNRIRKFVKPYRVDDGKRFRLKDHDATDSIGLEREKAEKLLAKGVERLADLQDRLYAQDKWARPWPNVNIGSVSPSTVPPHK